jgi:YidC/Oxa1 family membrane protein insertase
VGGVPTPAPDAPEETVLLDTPEYEATFSSWGGALKSLTLKGEKYRKTRDGQSVPVDLVHFAPGEPYPMALAVAPELGGAPQLVGDPALRAPMRITAREARSVTFEGRVGELNVRKRFTVGEHPYELGLELSLSGAPRAGNAALVFGTYLHPETPKPGFFSGGAVGETAQALCRGGEKTVRFKGDEAAHRVPGAAEWAGVDQSYFVAAVMPKEPAGECVLAKGAVPGSSLAAIWFPVQGDTTRTFTLFAGPKQVDLLRGYERDLDTSINYGPVTNLFSFFARLLLWIMRMFERVTHNWGIAIILLTFVVKLVLFPLTSKSMQSMGEMRRLQPEIEKLKVKHGQDKEKMNLAVMQLYQQHKVNPLGGCLPMLLQMPIWLALYATLQTSVELYREPFLWIRDLTHHDPLYILPITMGVSSFVMQKISPQPADNAQAKMLLYIMPIFFTFIMFKLPAGLTLYILVNNVLSIVQQQWFLRRTPAAVPAKAA